MKNRSIQGVPVAPGLAVGPVHVVHAGPKDVPVWTVSKEDVPLEIGRLAEAVNAAAEKLEQRQERVATTASQKDAKIFAVHRLILQDPNALRQVEEAISQERINAEAAVQKLIDRFETSMGQEAGGRSFASDVTDPWRFVLDVLLERDREEILHKSDRVILAAVELTPKVTTFLERDRILAVVAEAGGRFSHGAVLARAFGLPCVVGLPNLLARLEQNMMLLVDGDRGTVRLRPEQEEIDAFLEGKRSQESRRQAIREECSKPAVTQDGKPLRVQVNIEGIRDFDTFRVEDTDGVGLLRTEFLYMERDQFPSEEEQYRLYRRALEQLEGRQATFRLLDIGGDKPLPYFKTPPETNPALGWRGIRVTLKWRDLLRVQLRAFLRASVAGELRILMPMVTSVEEIEEIHETFLGVRQELLGQGYEVAKDVAVGAMIEVPSVLMTLDRVAEIVDFVSVGTNDLVQYLLAVDRDNSWVSDLYNPLHPSVLRALQNVSEAAQRAGIPASVCGDMAADPVTALLLLGMGYESVSVSPQFLPEIRFAVRRVDYSAVTEWARQALDQRASEGVRELLASIKNEIYSSKNDPATA